METSCAQQSRRWSWLLAAVVLCLVACATPRLNEPASTVAADSSRTIAPLVAASAAAPLSGAELADAIGSALARDCPPDSLDAISAHRQCADALTQDATLRASLPSFALRWGAQAAGAGFDLTRSNTTWLDSLVWTRLYLSTFAFPGGHRIERDGERFVVRVPVVFRNALDAGEYPYPFWHSPAKWKSYEQSEALLVFIERSSIIAVLRSETLDAARPHSERAWDEHWQWQSAHGLEPRVALFTYLFSSDNPHVASLEQAFRAFSEKQREAACTSCHNPSNPSQINPLEFFNYPNQALTARHDIVDEIVKNRMPPEQNGVPAGIADPVYRRELLALAEAFAATGDRALEYEKAQGLRAKPASAR